MTSTRGALRLVATHPQIAAEWHPSLNNALVLSDISPGSGKQAWWLCSKGHDYQMSVLKRTLGRNCPYCSNRALLPGYNDLATLRPDLAAQWHPIRNGDLTPADVFPNSNQHHWWQDEHGHEWEATGNKRAAGKNCPYCSGRYALEGETDLETTHPELAAQWHPSKNLPLAPSQVKAGSGDRVWWQDEHGHEWAAVVNSRTSGSGCPICASQQILTGFNDLATGLPEIAAQWHPTRNGDLTPQQVAPSSNRKAWWQDEHGHEWQAVIGSRQQNGCPVCSNRKLASGVNDLQALEPELAKLWHPTRNGALRPTDVTPSYGKAVWWLCELGHEWEGAIKTARRMQRHCPYCSNRRVLVGYNDLATVSPTVAAQWHPTLNGEKLPTQYTVGSDHRAWWLCEQGHEWETWIYSRQASGCAVCARQQTTSKGEQQLGEIVQQLTDDDVLLSSLGQLGRKNRELDLYVPARKLAVEYNGIYWHSEAAGKTPDSHYAKWQECAERGITLLQVWEDDWRDRRDIVIRMLAYRLGDLARAQRLLPELPEYYFTKVGARSCRIVPLQYAQASAFLQLHHIQGSARGSHYVGLEDSEQRLRAVMVFSRTRTPGEYTLERYATAGNVAGGFTKLLKHATETLQLKKVITFAALDVSNGRLYENSGFRADGEIKPDYFYLVGNSRVHKFNYRKSRFRKDDRLKYDPALTETQLAALNHLIRVWDAGKIRYVLEVPSD